MCVCMLLYDHWSPCHRTAAIHYRISEPVATTKAVSASLRPPPPASAREMRAAVNMCTWFMRRVRARVQVRDEKSSRWSELTMRRGPTVVQSGARKSCASSSKW